MSDKKYPDWLSPKRLNKEKKKKKQKKADFSSLGFKNITDQKRSPFQRDIDIITFDSAFRRLAGKTQVSLNPTKDFIRTRLTHSIEVSRIGRQAARMLADIFWGRCDCDNDEKKRAFEDAVSAACLVHDIGHPAFGHAGEKKLDKLLKAESAKYGWELEFEGNKQNFRLLAGENYKARSGKNSMNLTCAVLDGICKYKLKKDGVKAGGVYVEDKKKLEKVLKRTKCKEVLNPITYLVELADDISYCASDIEDALKHGWVSKGVVAKTLCEVRLVGYTKGWKPINYNQWGAVIDKYVEKDCFESLKTAIIKGLLVHAMDIFDQLDVRQVADNDIPAYLAKQWGNNPILERDSKVFQKDGTKYIKDNIFKGGFLSHPHIKQAESQADIVIERIWDHFINHGMSNPHSIEGLVPKDFFQFFSDNTKPHQERVRAVADYISGMTDRYALFFIDMIDARRGSLR